MSLFVYSEPNMMLGILLLVFFSPYLVIANEDDILSKFTQSDYQVKDLMLELEYYNEKCISRMESKLFKPTRTIQAMNFTVTFKIDVLDQLQVLVQAYKFLSNQYKTFPVRVQLKFCKVVKENVLGVKGALKCGNFSECYFKKDTTYHLCNFIPDISKLPPLIPDGRYMIRIQTIFEKQILWSVKAYAEVYRSVYIPDN